MMFFELLLTAVSLSMDAVAVSACYGMGLSAGNRRSMVRTAFWVSLYFGIAQMLMPIAGYYLSSTLAGSLQKYAPYIAFGLLLFVGGKMFLEGLKSIRDKQAAPEARTSLRPGVLLPLAVATSIDALVVGVRISLFDRAPMIGETAFNQPGIFASAALIGVVTFALCAAAVLLGQRLSAKLRSTAEMLGGAVLIAIGAKILVDSFL